MGYVATGVVITFAGGFMAEIIDEVSGPNLTREDIDMSHHGTTGAHEFEPSKLYNGGELSCSLAFAPATEPPILDARETVTITEANSAGDQWSFPGYLKGFEAGRPFEGRATAKVTIKVAGDVSINGTPIA